MTETATAASTGDTAETAAPEPAAAEADPAAEATPDAPAGRKPMSRKAKVRLFVILGVALLVAVAFGVRYVVDTSNYVTTDNAQVDGNQISINAPASGTLLDWRGRVGRRCARTALWDGSRFRAVTSSRRW